LAGLTTPAATDLVPVVDVSDTTMAISGTNKKSTIDNLSKGLTITESQISDLGTYSTDIHSNITALNAVSGTNTGDQDLTALATKANVLELDNTTSFTPDADYEPATKKYVDDNGGGGGLSWSEVTANATMAVDTGSLANKGTLLTLTLPATSAVGKTVRVAGMNAGLWKIAQAASQYIKFGNTTTTTGAGGSLASTLTYDAVELVCIEANVGWTVVSSVGNVSIV